MVEATWPTLAQGLLLAVFAFLLVFALQPKNGIEDANRAKMEEAKDAIRRRRG